MKFRAHLGGDHPEGVGEHDTDDEGGAIHGIMARVRAAPGGSDGGTR